MYTSIPTVPSRPPLPAATPPAFALLLATTAVVAVAESVPSKAAGEPVWPAAWLLAALAFALFGARGRLPAPSHSGAVALRLAAVGAAAALLVRRADLALLQAAPIFPGHERLLFGITSSELVMCGLLVAAAGATSSAESVRGPRPGILVPAVLVLGWIGWVVVAAPNRLLPAPAPAVPPRAVLPALALVWTAALLGPPALIRGPSRLHVFFSRAAPLMGAAAIVGMAGTLLRRVPRFETLGPLGSLGSDLGLPYGAGVYVAASAEVFLCLIAIWILLALGARGAARAGGVSHAVVWIVAAAALAAALLATQSQLLLATGILGWATAGLGLGERPSENS